MGIFQHAGVTVSYNIESAPFAHDLLLLQSSKFNTGFWRPVLESFEEEATRGGRIVTCEWSEFTNADPDKSAETLRAMIRGLGLGPLDAVACGEAVAALKLLESDAPPLIRRKLVFPSSLPKMDELIRLIREFCGF